MVSKYKVSQKFIARLLVKSQSHTSQTYAFHRAIRIVSTRDNVENILRLQSCLFLDQRERQLLKQRNANKCTLELVLSADETLLNDNATYCNKKDALREAITYYNTYNKEAH